MSDIIRIVAIVVLLILFMLKWGTGVSLIKKKELNIVKLKYWILFSILIEWIFVFGNLVFNH